MEQSESFLKVISDLQAFKFVYLKLYLKQLTSLLTSYWPHINKNKKIVHRLRQLISHEYRLLKLKRERLQLGKIKFTVQEFYSSGILIRRQFTLTSSHRVVASAPTLSESHDDVTKRRRVLLAKVGVITSLGLVGLYVTLTQDLMIIDYLLPHSFNNETLLNTTLERIDVFDDNLTALVKYFNLIS